MKHTQNEQFFQSLCQYIENHLTEELTYDRLLKQFSVPQYYLTCRFPKAVGTTLTNYIIRKRLDLAVSKVQAGQGLEEAAFSSGFHTYSHFYKAFRKHYGQPPRVYFRNK